MINVSLFRQSWQSLISLPQLSLICVLAATALAVNPIVVQEQEFIDSKTNQRFQILGIDYQEGSQSAYGTGAGDPLSNGTKCLRDAALMQAMGVNTIRSYNVDPTLNHDQCMSIFNMAGIAVVLDVNSPLPGQSLDRSNPSGTYNAGYLTHIFQVVEAFKNYDNILGFFAGNEVINDPTTAKNDPPYIRAVQRDLKAYIAAHAPRAIPVGYSAADVRNVLQDTWAYLQCDNSNGSGNDTSRSDFFGLNSYSWCGNASSYTMSGYDQLVAIFGNTTIPVFFSEYGCNKPSPRFFDEVPTLYGPLMTALSGGLVYEWTEETEDFGLINAYANGSASLRQDFVTLNNQFAKLNSTLLTSSNNTATSLKPPKCGSNLISNDGFSTNFNIPAQPNGVSALIQSGVTGGQTGSFVSVTQTAVQVSVYNTNGAAITGLAIKSVDGANRVGLASFSAPVSGVNAAPAQTTTSSSSKAGGAQVAVATNGAVLGAAIAVAALVL